VSFLTRYTEDGRSLDERAEPVMPWSKRAFTVLAAVAVALPTGSFLGLNVKWALASLLIVCLGVELLLGLGRGKSQRALATGLAGFSLCAVAALYSAARGNSPALVLAQTTELLTMTGLVSVGYFLFREDERGFSGLVDALLLGAGVMSLVKLTGLGLLLTGALDFEGLSDLAETIFGQEVRGLNFDGSLPRLSIGSDLALPFVVYLGIRDRRLGWIGRGLVAIIVLSVVLSLTRYLWLAIGVVLVLTVGSHLWRHAKAALGTAVVLIGSGVFMISHTDMGQATIEARFLSEANLGGDDVRVEQSTVLFQEFLHTPVLGKGLGSYAPDLVRSESAPYSYENQWLALAMQLGICGLSAILLLPAWILFMQRGLVPATLGTVDSIVFVLFLLQGFTNPTLTTSPSAMVVLAFAVAASQHHESPIARTIVDQRS
jgi:hypothetical protein